MNITMESLPLYCLMLVITGVIIVVIGILRLASAQEEDRAVQGNNQHIEDLFSYFLQEEETKNAEIRKMARKAYEEEEKQPSDGQQNISQQAISLPEDEHTLYQEMMRRYEAGERPEEIAKSLQKGIGEVKLMISLYAKRQ